MSLNILRLNIAEPCHEKWQYMSITEQGAYCKSCCKEVIDFSSLTDEEIVDYFEKRIGEKICGRLKNDQLNKPLVYISPEVLSMDIPLWKKFIAVIFICFSSFIVGCKSQPPSFEDIPLPPPVHAISATSLTVIKKNKADAITKKDSLDCVVTFGNIIATYEVKPVAPIILVK
jgi:hypothetical protein